MGSSSVLVVFAIFCLVIISGLTTPAIDTPRCEFAIEPRAVDKLVRCYSLGNLKLLESFIEDDRPVKVQVVNGPLDKFHLSSAHASDDDGG